MIFGLVLSGLLVPFHVTAIPLFLGLAELRMLNSYAALIVPFVASVFRHLPVPPVLRPAAGRPVRRRPGRRAERDGDLLAHRLPARPAGGERLRGFSVTAHWNDLFWPLIVTSDPALATPPRGIVFFRDAEAGDNVGPLMAAAVIVTAPLIVGFLLAQRTFTRGIAAGGLRG